MRKHALVLTIDIVQIIRAKKWFTRALQFSSNRFPQSFVSQIDDDDQQVKHERNSNHAIKVFVEIVRKTIQISWIGKVDLHLRNSDEEKANGAKEICR